MFKALLKFFQKEEPTRIEIHHEKLGKMIYSDLDESWETDGNEIYHGGIKGTADGPNENAIQEIQRRINKIDEYWSICSEDLKHIALIWFNYTGHFNNGI
jgi:hypothetical protein